MLRRQRVEDIVLGMVTVTTGVGLLSYILHWFGILPALILERGPGGGGGMLEQLVLTINFAATLSIPAIILLLTLSAKQSLQSVLQFSAAALLGSYFAWIEFMNHLSGQLLSPEFIAGLNTVLSVVTWSVVCLILVSHWSLRMRR